ncbi:DUF4209 domain-containing protein [Telmatocola sphagniphila]|uniref:DUF4209 domain-containing protein n=1 Tax=Telmatocola sphagniphila TaxID=1123043 RepID=A0A8E6B6K6_9BACT|nr:DUF4209 domain-containing protein [Telmatocola sphagniphila]QVL32106.1 DUF4209 domain-containing protein [Telmatocola sphagniphila]
MKAHIDEIIHKFETFKKNFTEDELAEELIKLIPNLNPTQSDFELEAEIFAFRVRPITGKQLSRYGSEHYYTPFSEYENSQFPSIIDLNEKWISYWIKRSEDVTHPIFKYRYSDIAWDMMPRLKMKDNRVTKTTIRAAIDIAKSDLDVYLHTTYARFERSIQLAILTKEDDLLQELCSTIIEFYKSKDTEKTYYVWKNPYDLLLESSCKSKISIDSIIEIINNLENNLAKYRNLFQEYSSEPEGVKFAATRLAEFYNKAATSSDVTRVLKVYADAYIEKIKNHDIKGIITTAWMQEIHKTLQQYNLNDLAAEAIKMYSECAKKMSMELHPLTSSIHIPNGEIECIIKNFIEAPGDVFTNLAIQGLPNFEQDRKDIKGLVAQFPLQNLVTKKLIARDGREQGSIGSAENDEGGALKSYWSITQPVKYFLYRQIIEACISRNLINKENFSEYIHSNHLFSENKKLLTERAIKSYLENDWISALHLFLPQLESAIRLLIKFSDGYIIKKSRSGAFHLRILDDLLRDPILLNIFKSEDEIFYMRYILTDQLGLNVRNRLFHGDILPNEINPYLTDCVFHIGLLLASLHAKEKTIV